MTSNLGSGYIFGPERASFRLDLYHQASHRLMSHPSSGSCYLIDLQPWFRGI